MRDFKKYRYDTRRTSFDLITANLEALLPCNQGIVPLQLFYNLRPAFQKQTMLGRIPGNRVVPHNVFVYSRVAHEKKACRFHSNSIANFSEKQYGDTACP